MRSCLLALAVALSAPITLAQGSFTNFESPLVHPIAISPDGTRLFAANTSDYRLSVFDLAQPSSPKLVAEIPVGVEPVSVRARTNDEVWVVNHTSDTVSVVSVSQGMVIDTIQVKDEPCDVVFAGTPARAYVSVARSAEVRVFDVATHALLATIPMPGETPQALAVSADGSKVYAAFAMSGNRTTTIPHTVAPNQPPPTNFSLPLPPKVALIVDATDPVWAPTVIQYTIPDHDVAEIDAATNAVTRTFDRVGTILLGIAVNPASGDLLVTGTDARNLIRFEPNLRGHFVDNLVSRIAIGSGAVTKVDLNPGLNYAVLPNPAALATALAQPADVVFDPSGASAYVAAFGTDRVAKLDASGAVLKRIEVGPAHGSAADPRTKRGPRGLALHAGAHRLYVQNRISSTITVIATDVDAVVNEIPLGGFNPEPVVLRLGRGFLYDAKLSGNGTASCAACHVDGDMDFLAWDLGNPGGSMTTVVDPAGINGQISMHPMKGPMMTQTLKGLAGSNPLHWRGDRQDFLAFNPTFDTLMGGSQIAQEDMSLFHGFAKSMTLEPNPNLKLDGTLPSTVDGFSPALGKTTYQSFLFDNVNACASCHILPGGTTPFLASPGQLQDSQGMDIPHLRNIYRKNGLSKTGASKSGFGLSHDGTESSVVETLSKNVFPLLMNDATKKGQLQAFLKCIETGSASAVGATRTISATTAGQLSLINDVSTLRAQAVLQRIDLVGKGLVDGVMRGLSYDTATASFLVDKTGVGPFTWAELQAKALAGNAFVTLLAVPPGSGVRVGIDRDLDGVLDGDEPNATGLESYGAPSQTCAGAMSAGANSAPVVGNGVFAITCASAKPGTLALGLIGDEPIPSGLPIFGVSVLVDPLSTFALGISLAADAAGFAVGPLPIPAGASLAGLVFYAQVLGISDCAANGLAASQGLKITLLAP